MWQQDPQPLLHNPALLPLAALCQTDTPERLLSQVGEELAKIEPSAERGQIAACSEILAGLRFEKSLIKQLFREDIMRESVIYQDILQEGQKQALKTSIFDALEVRFNSVPPQVSPKLEGEGLTPENLRALLRQALTCATLDEFISQL